MPFAPILDVISPQMMLVTCGLGIAALFLLTLVIALVEGVVLTLLKWNPFLRALLIAALMNILSSLAGAVLLVFLQDTPIIWLVIGFLLSVVIEGGVMTRFPPRLGWRTWLFAFIANLASYLLLILPAYLYSLADVVTP